MGQGFAQGLEGIHSLVICIASTRVLIHQEIKGLPNVPGGGNRELRQHKNSDIGVLQWGAGSTRDLRGAPFNY